MTDRANVVISASITIGTTNGVVSGIVRKIAEAFAMIGKE